ncbi:MAG TPA: signal peptide peptidase SppA [Tepidisphaeraceae bacterium]|nr:signal peptide peptidase SppA [Tepidisphaeraceae bacterium]
MVPQSPPPGQGPVDPRGAFSPPPPPSGPGGPTMQQLPPMPMPGPMPGMPGMYPPMMMPMPFGPPPKRERSFARAIFTTLATSIFGLSLVANIYLLFLSGLVGGDESTTQSTVHIGNPEEKIAVIPVEGVITQGTSEMVGKWLQTVERDPHVKAIVLSVDTPGGGVTASDEIYNRVMQVKKNRGIPVAVSMKTVAASGGYYVSAGADQIFAEPTTITGSIGVLMPSFNFNELGKKWGIKEDTIVAPPDGLKNAGSMFSDPDPREKPYLQAIANQIYDRFTTVVKDGRGTKLKGTIKEICDGRIYTANDALKNGLIDQIGYTDDVYAWVKTKANLKDPQIVKFQRPIYLLNFFGGESRQKGGGELYSKGGPLSITINLDAAALDELRSPRVLYLWRGE